MNLRTATVADVDTLARLELDLFGADAWSAATLTGDLDTPGRRVVVAVEGERVVGYAVTGLAGDLVDLLRIAVDPDRQGRGVARTLLEAMVEAGTLDGGDAVLLEVSAENAVALGLYRAAGFAEIDRRRGYYRDGSDAVVMRLPLRAAAGPGRG